MAKNRRGLPPDSIEPFLERQEAPVLKYEGIIEFSEELEPGVLVLESLEAPKELDFSHMQKSYSVVRNGDIYQLVQIIFDRESLSTFKGEVIFESTDRWETQAQFTFQTEEEFLLKDSL